MRTILDIDEDVFLPCYQHLRDSADDIVFLWGGRDSGKSVFVAQHLLLKCLSPEYFRCILIRKTAESIKDSQWQLMYDWAVRWGIDHLFTFKTSPLEITCNKNGNKFICRGCDKPGKLKSISNPSHVWYEEMNQLSESDYITISTTLRSDEGRVQEWCTFNPEAEEDYEDFWLYRNFFSEQYERGIYTFNKTVSVDLPGGQVVNLKYSSTHTTYHDNEYSPLDRIARAESLSTTSPYFYKVYTLGLWGKAEAKMPFCTHYKPEKHESTLAVFNPNQRITISVDFNIDPFAITFRHRWRDQYGPHCHVFDEGFIPGGTIPAMIDFVLSGPYVRYLPNCLLTGDFRGAERSLEQRDHASKFQQLARGWSLHTSQVIVSPNPLHTQSGNDVNYVLLYHPDFKIHPEKCKGTCRDMRNVQKDNHGSIIKLNRTDPNQRADFLDTIRYDIHNFEREWIDQHQRSQKRLGT